MEKELRKAPLSFRSQMNTKIRSYRKDVSKLQQDVRSNDIGHGFRSDVKYTEYSAENEQSNYLGAQRALLLQGTDSLNRATQSIDRSHRIAAETDQIGSDIIEELGGQREQLERSKDRGYDKQVATGCYHPSGSGNSSSCCIYQVLQQTTLTQRYLCNFSIWDTCFSASPKALKFLTLQESVKMEDVLKYFYGIISIHHMLNLVIGSLL
ncbi:vesicle transport through interaction with t-SNAREs homolog 1B isoform X3 [Chiloscyllium plagiosum]|nr:vesicle transport through interaction with t-SNAREs homolog 1B isoform X3 [Chiloscyllium plagiosum]